MAEADLLIALDSIKQEIQQTEAQLQFATGKYADAFAYKLKYANTMYDALLEDLRKLQHIN